MKARLHRTTFETWLLAAAALSTVSVQSIEVREPDTWTTMCDQGNGSCDWPSEDAIVKRRTTLDELLAHLATSPRYHANVVSQMNAGASPTLAAYAYGHIHGYGPRDKAESQRQQPLFMVGGRQRSLAGLGASGLATWDAYGPSSPLRPYRFFNGDNKRARYAFSSWGGKRSAPDAARVNQNDDNGRDGNDDALNSGAFNAKLKPSFSSWGGKRTFSSWGGKRSQKFFNWGGKRILPEETSDGAMAETSEGEQQEGAEVAPTYSNEHAVIKREVAGGEDVLTAEMAAKRDPSAAGAHSCASDTRNLRRLLNEFIEWSRKQPEQKKASLYRKMLSVRTLRGAESPSRRAGSFYPWGGKRNSKLKDD